MTRMYLVNLRKEKNYSQKQVANLMQTTQQTYNLIEKGQRQKNLGIKTLKKMSEIFEVPLENLIKSEFLFIDKQQILEEKLK